MNPETIATIVDLASVAAFVVFAALSVVVAWVIHAGEEHR